MQGTHYSLSEGWQRSKVTEHKHNLAGDKNLRYKDNRKKKKEQTTLDPLFNHFPHAQIREERKLNSHEYNIENSI